MLTRWATTWASAATASAGQPRAQGWAAAGSNPLLADPRSWLLWSLPRRAVRYILAVQMAAVLALGLALRSSPLRGNDLRLFVLLTLCAAISVEGSRHLGAPSSRRDRPYKDMLSTWMLPVVLLLPPVYAVVMPVPVYLYVQLRVTRIASVKRVFNAAAVGLAGYLAASLHLWLVGAARGQLQLVGSLQTMAVTVLAALLFAAVSAQLVAGVLRRLTPGLTRRMAFGGLALHTTEGAELCIGIMVAVSGVVNPVLVLLGLLPILLLQRTLLHDELLRAARTDDKTGLANPRHWREVADREISRARLGAQPLAVLLVDIDRFKRVNDTRGHLAGDRVLAVVAEALQAAVRPRDLVGRFGGEEFVLLLSEATPASAHATAERVRARVQKLRLPTDERGDWGVTISVGVACLTSHGNDLNELLASADLALYDAKRSGRNCVRMPALDAAAVRSTAAAGQADP